MIVRPQYRVSRSEHTLGVSVRCVCELLVLCILRRRSDITPERHAKESIYADNSFRIVGMTSKKRSRLDRHQLFWQDLRPELLEKIFSSVDGPDRRRARLVCRAFRDAASRSVKLLVIGSKHDGERHEQAESEFIEQQVELLKILSPGGPKVHTYWQTSRHISNLTALHCR